jgi:hypothetical protein
MKTFDRIFTQYLVFGLCFILFFFSSCDFLGKDDDNKSAAPGQTYTPIQNPGSNASGGNFDNISNLEQLRSAFTQVSLASGSEDNVTKFLVANNELKVGGLFSTVSYDDYKVLTTSQDSAELLIEGTVVQTQTRENLLNRLFNIDNDNSTYQTNFQPTQICMTDGQGVRAIRAYIIEHSINQMGQGFIQINRFHRKFYVVSLDGSIPVLANPLVEENSIDKVYNHVVQINNFQMIPCQQNR